MSYLFPVINTSSTTSSSNTYAYSSSTSNSSTYTITYPANSATTTVSGMTIIVTYPEGFIAMEEKPLKAFKGRVCGFLKIEK